MVIEGNGVSYITGSGQTQATSDRVHIYETEGNVQKRKRLRKRKFDDTSYSNTHFVVSGNMAIECTAANITIIIALLSSHAEKKMRSESCKIANRHDRTGKLSAAKVTREDNWQVNSSVVDETDTSAANVAAVPFPKEIPKLQRTSSPFARQSNSFNSRTMNAWHIIPLPVVTCW